MLKHLLFLWVFIGSYAILNATDIRKTAFEYYPLGVIFSKEAPNDLQNINFDTDFCYFYFSPSLEQLCQLKRADLCTGTINAKKHFPDYEAYFADDLKVVREFTDNKVLAFTEPWSPPGIDSWVYSRKTGFQSNKAMYMLGCFDLVNDTTLGIAKFKIISHNAQASLSSMSTKPIPENWFIDAFNALPNGMAILDFDENVIHTNKQWEMSQSSNHNQDLIASINQNFLSKHFTKEDLLTSAAWLTNVTLPNGCSYDIGTYGIQEKDHKYQIIVLRPPMQYVASPHWDVHLEN